MYIIIRLQNIILHPSCSAIMYLHVILGIHIHCVRVSQWLCIMLLLHDVMLCYASIFTYIYMYMLMIYVYIYNTYRRLNQTLPGLFCELRLVSLLRSFSSMLVREAREAKLSLGFSHGDFPCHGGTPIAGWSAWLILIGKSHNKNG